MGTNGYSAVAAGDNSYGQLDVGTWENVVTISAGTNHSVGCVVDGTVVAVGDNSYGQLDVENWNDIAYVASGANHTVGLKADGTVVATGDNNYGQLDVETWDDIESIAAGKNHTIGLKSDGTVVAVGDNQFGQLETASCRNIAVIQAGGDHTIGLSRSTSNGNVAEILIAGSDNYNELAAQDWDNNWLFQVSAEYLTAQDIAQLQQHVADQEQLFQLMPFIFAAFGLGAAIIYNLIFRRKTNVVFVLIESIAGLVGAFILGGFASFAADETGPFSFFMGLVGAFIATGIAVGTINSVVKNRVATQPDGNEMPKPQMSVVNKGFWLAIAAWIVNGLIVGIMITIRTYDIFNSPNNLQVNLPYEFVRLSATNIGLEAMIWVPIILVAGGIYRKKGAKATIMFVVKGFVISLAIWGGLMWWISGS